MTKRKKRLWITSISVLCLCAILFSLFWFVPALKYEIFGIPIKTDVFLPEPDRMVGYYAGTEVILSDEHREMIYDAFVSFMDTSVISAEQKKTNIRWDDQKADSLCVEFCYDRPYRYEGSVEKIHIPSGLTFDVMGISISFNQVSLVGFLEGQRVDEEQAIALKLENDAALLESVIGPAIAGGIPNPMGAPLETSNAQVLATDVLFEKPDAMRIARNGKSLQLSDAQRDQLFAAFSDMRNLQEHPQTGPYGVREIYTAQQVYENMNNSTCLEFRYDQRRSFHGIMAQLCPHESDGEWGELRLSFAFDSIVMLIDENNHVGIVIGKDGLYRASLDFYRSFDFGPGYSDFCAKVLEASA